MAERRGPATFRERDLTSAVKAVRKAGEHVYAAEIARNGTIRIIVSAEAAMLPEKNPWDDED